MTIPISFAGTVVSAASGTPYLLTSDRCFTDKTQVEALQFWLLVFNRQAACAANAATPPIRQVMQVLPFCIPACISRTPYLLQPGSNPGMLCERGLSIYAMLHPTVKFARCPKDVNVMLLF